MKRQIERLIKDYELQIVEYDRCLEITKKQTSKVRKGESKSKILSLSDLIQERKILNAQKQRTIQFISDLEYLDID